MSLKKIHDRQPELFEFTKDNKNKAEKILKKYPEERKKSAVMPFLYLAQKQNENWIPLSAMKYIAKYLEMPYIKVYEVVYAYPHTCTQGVRGQFPGMRKAKENVRKCFNMSATSMLLAESFRNMSEVVQNTSRQPT